jgi:hypothetical protein
MESLGEFLGKFNPLFPENSKNDPRNDNDADDPNEAAMFDVVAFPQNNILPVTAPFTQPHKRELPPELIRPELNIERHADFIFVPAHSKKVRQTRRREGYLHLHDGRKERSFLEITPLQGGKTPTTTTRKIYLALQKICEERKHGGGLTKDGSFAVSSREIMRTAKLLICGKNNQKVQDELHTLRSCFFRWENVFIAPSGEIFQALETTNILDKCRYITRKEREKTDDQYHAIHIIRFAEYIRNNLDSNKTKPLHYETVMSIKGEFSLMLYTRLDIFLSDKDKYERKSQSLFADLHFDDEPRYQYPSQRKEVLEKAIKELHGKRISTGTLGLILSKTKDGSDWKITARRLYPLAIDRKKANDGQDRAPKRRFTATNPPERIELLEEDLHQILHPSTPEDWGLSSNWTENRVKAVLGYHRSPGALIDRLSKSD